MSFTKGPWNVVTEVYPAHKRFLIGPSLEDEIENTEDNLRLQSAAPEMFEVLMKASELIEKGVIVKAYLADDMELIHFIRSMHLVLKKAKGE